MDQQLKVSLQQLEAEKGIDRDTLLEAIRSAIESAARKSMNRSANVTVEMNPDTLEFRVFEIRTVTESVDDPASEISLEEALTLNPDVVLGNRLKLPAEPKDFGRIAAQTAKQVIIQKLKDPERDRIYEESGFGAGTFTWSRGVDAIRVDWEYEPTGGTDVRTFTVEYRVLGGLWVYPGRDTL